MATLALATVSGSADGASIVTLPVSDKLRITGERSESAMNVTLAGAPDVTVTGPPLASDVSLAVHVYASWTSGLGGAASTSGCAAPGASLGQPVTVTGSATIASKGAAAPVPPPLSGPTLAST
jgi:hypothetical protein